jgi:hypothetical protein
LVVSKVYHPRVPLERIHILCIFFTCPKISHFHGSGSLPFNGVVCHANGCCIVAVDRYFWLWMAKILKGEFKIIPSWQLRNNATNLALAANATTNHKIKRSVWKTPLSLMGFPSIGKDPIKKRLHALLRAFGLLKYNASEWMFITMFDAQSCTVVLGCVAK